MKLIKEQIVLPDTYSLTQEASSYVAGLLMESQGIEVVTDPQSQQHAVTMGREIRKHLSEVETTRQQLKEPILAAGRLLDSLAKTHVEPMEKEIDRLEKLVNDFQRTEKDRVAEEERKRQAEIARLEAEAAAAAQAVQTATSQASDTGRACPDSPDGQHSFTPDVDHDPTGKTINCEYCGAPVNDQEAEAAQAEADIAAANAQANLEAAEAAARAAITAPLPEANKAKGAATGQKLCWQVTNVDALYKARPDLCNPPTPKKSAINSTCSAPEDATAAAPAELIPGLKTWWEDKTVIRR
jgi:hypothetical protein